jgi:putative transposase
MWYYQSKKDDREIIDKLNDLADKHPHRGFDTYFGRIREEGHPWNRKRVLRAYRMMKLQMRCKRKKRLPSRVREPLVLPKTMNETWSMDFMCDTLESGRRFRILTAIDDFNREALIVKAQTIFPAEHVVRTLNELIFYRGKPIQIRVDNGPEFMSQVFTTWYTENQIKIKYIQPGKPVQNAYVERCNRLYREDVLDAYLFSAMDQVQIISENWMEDYNENHPQGSLGGKAPRQYARINIPGFCENIIFEELSETSLSDKG